METCFACLQQWHVKNLNEYPTRKFSYLFLIIINLNGWMTICLLWKGCKFVFRIRIILSVCMRLTFSMGDVYRWQRTFSINGRKGIFFKLKYWPVGSDEAWKTKKIILCLWYLLHIYWSEVDGELGCMGKLREMTRGWTEQIHMNATDIVDCVLHF